MGHALEQQALAVMVPEKLLIVPVCFALLMSTASAAAETASCKILPCPPVCKDAAKATLISSVSTPSIVLPRNGAYKLCSPDKACLEANRKCRASIARQQKQLDAALANTLKEFTTGADDRASNGASKPSAAPLKIKKKIKKKPEDMQPGSFHMMQTESPTRGPQEAWLRASGHTDRGSGHTSSNNGCKDVANECSRVHHCDGCITNYNAMEMHLKPKDECQETCARICAEEGRPQAFGNCGADKMKANDLVKGSMASGRYDMPGMEADTVSPSWSTPSQDMQPGSMNMPTPSQDMQPGSMNMGWMEDGGTVSPSRPTPSQDMQPGSMNMPTPSDPAGSMPYSMNMPGMEAPSDPPGTWWHGDMLDLRDDVGT